MANPRSSKWHLERARQERAAEKRERKKARAEAETPDVVADDASQEELLDELARLHEEYSGGSLTLDDFEERKAELTSRLRVE